MGKYLCVKGNTLSSLERIVNVQIDEIFVKSALIYTAEKLTGTASSANEGATTVHSFIISSMFSSYI